MSHKEKCGETSQFVKTLIKILSLVNISIHREEIIQEDLVEYLEGIVCILTWNIQIANFFLKVMLLPINELKFI